MGRSSDKHSPRMDDVLAAEAEPLERGAPVDGRAEPRRAGEAPESYLLLRPDLGDDEHIQIVGRSQLATALRPSEFPARAGRLAEVATEEGLPEWSARLRALPEQRVFHTTGEVWEALQSLPPQTAPPKRAAPSTRDVPSTHSAPSTPVAPAARTQDAAVPLRRLSAVDVVAIALEVIEDLLAWLLDVVRAARSQLP